MTRQIAASCSLPILQCAFVARGFQPVAVTAKMAVPLHRHCYAPHRPCAALTRLRFQTALLEELRREIRRLEEGHHAAPPAVISTGIDLLDRCLPGGGFRAGTLVEWLGAEGGHAATTLAMGAARMACRAAGTLVVLDRRGEFYPPAAFRSGFRPEQLLVVQPANQADLVWAMDQVMRCPGAAAMLAWPDRLSDRDFRRLQLAASSGGGLGLLVRPPQARRTPSWAEVRLGVNVVEDRGGQSHFRYAKIGTVPERRLGVDVIEERIPGQVGQKGTVPLRQKGTVPFSLRENRDSPQCENRDSPQCENRDSPQCENGDRPRRRLRIVVLHVRGGPGGMCVDVEIDEQTGVVRPVAELGDPAASPSSGRRARRA